MWLGLGSIEAREFAAWGLWLGCRLAGCFVQVGLWLSCEAYGAFRPSVAWARLETWEFAPRLGLWLRWRLLLSISLSGAWARLGVDLELARWGCGWAAGVFAARFSLVQVCAVARLEACRDFG